MIGIINQNILEGRFVGAVDAGCGRKGILVEVNGNSKGAKGGEGTTVLSNGDETRGSGELGGDMGEGSGFTSSDTFCASLQWLPIPHMKYHMPDLFKVTSVVPPLS